MINRFICKTENSEKSPRGSHQNALFCPTNSPKLKDIQFIIMLKLEKAANSHF